MEAKFLSGIPKADSLVYDENGECIRNYTAGRESIQKLAEGFDAKPMMDETATKECFMNDAPKSRLLHLQTHCNWSIRDPLYHHVEFPAAADGTSEGPEPAPVAKLTAREVFDMRLPPGTHINMVACRGGVASVEKGDEVMGLIPALLYSGASSTISTLWKVDDDDGAEFAFSFFDSFLDQCAAVAAQDMATSGPPTQRGGEGAVPSHADNPCGIANFVDIARALREAAREMDYEHRSLYDWAGYVLHGFWQYPVSEKDLERIRRKQG